MTPPGAPAYLVAGAGPAGLTVARLLALKGRRVVVAAGEPNQGASRLELLAPAAQSTMAALGLEPLLHDRAIARPCLGIRRPQSRIEHEDFLRHPAGQGHVVDRTRFDGCLRAAALAAGVEFLPLRVTGTAAEGDALRVRSRRGADGLLPIDGILIDATGRNAAIGRRMGTRTAFRDRLVAELIRDSKTPPAQGVADDAPCWLEYRDADSSWRYHIRGPGGRAQTWSISRKGVRSDGRIQGVDASACIRSQAAGDGWIAVGDAAMCFEPIASQGLFNALSSSLAAAGLLLSAAGLNPQTADAWCGAVAATFLRSEAGRAELQSIA
jgi:flavin-dependent dehydrogenase